jgi:molecular chaperone GrpE (heat shock protein)
MLLFSTPLFKSMKKAAANARNTIPSEEMSPDKKHYLEGMAELLDTLAEHLAKECESSRTKVEVEGPRQDRNIWEDLKKNLLGKIDAFEESLGAEHGD